MRERTFWNPCKDGDIAFATVCITIQPTLGQRSFASLRRSAMICSLAFARIFLLVSLLVCRVSCRPFALSGHGSLFSSRLSTRRSCYSLLFSARAVDQFVGFLRLSPRGRLPPRLLERWLLSLISLIVLRRESRGPLMRDIGNQTRQASIRPEHSGGIVAHTTSSSSSPTRLCLDIDLALFGRAA